MQCPVCLKEIDDDALVCPVCGEQFEKNEEVQKVIDQNKKGGKIRHIIFICIIIAAIIGIIVFLCVTGVIWWILGIAVVIGAIVVWFNG